MCVSARLEDSGQSALDAKDRAVAIRTLLVSTARDPPEVSLQKAVAAVQEHRRTRG